MAIRRQRPPRPGEILNWLASRPRYKYAVEEWGHAPHVRFGPAPCCGHAKHGGSLAINAGTGLWKCYKCAAKGNWFQLTSLAGEPLKDAYADAPKVDFAVYEKIRSRMRRPITGGHYPKLLEYCLSRGIQRETLDSWRITTCGEDAIRVPLYAMGQDRQWMIANARLRRVLRRGETTRADGSPSADDWFEVKGGPTCLAMGNHLLGQKPPQMVKIANLVASDWISMPLVGTDLSAIGEAIATVKRVLIVEGQWDAMTAYQLGIPNVLSLPNGASNIDMSAILRYVPDFAEVWFCYDNDEAGAKAGEAMFAQLGSKAKKIVIPEKDLNAWLMKKPDLNAEEVFSYEEKLTPKKKWASFDETEVEEKTEILCETPWPRLTRRLAGGFRAAQTTGLLAPSGSGKTTIANNIVAHSIQRGVKVGVIQLESTRKEVKEKLRNQILGWTGYHPDDLKELLDRVVLSNLEGKETPWEKTIEEATEMLKDGCRLIVMDNWDHIVQQDRNGMVSKARAYAELQKLCKQYEAHGLVIWQPNKVDRADHVNSGLQKGFSSAFQDADNYITINRHGMARRLDVEKARVDEVSEGDSIVWLRYDPQRKSLFETESQAALSLTETPSDKFD